MQQLTGDDTATHYLTARSRLVDLLATLTDDQLASSVPATPGWSVRDVVAHMAAITTDALAGRLTGIPTDEDTARQVAERRDRPFTDIVDEWAANAGPMADGARAGLVPPNLAVDALTHEQDIRGALGLAAVLTPAERRFCVGLYSLGLRRALKPMGAPLEVVATDTDFRTVTGDGSPAATVRTTEFELFRALPGRRSRRQVAGYEWSGDAAAYVDRFNVFGSLREDDVTDA